MWVRLARKLVRGAAAEAVSSVAFAVVSGHHNFFGLLERPDAGDRLRRWRPGDRLPLVFCHGYMGDGTNFLVLRRRLWLDGFRSQAAVWHWPFWRDCADYAALIGRRVDVVLARTGAPAVDLVAHSMGGLAARRYLADHRGGADVRKLITIGSPHHGTLAALAGPGRSAFDLRPRSAFLCALGGDLVNLDAGKVLSIHGDLDWLAPPSTARVEAPQENLLVEGLGHSGLLCSGRVRDAVRDALPAIAARRDVLLSSDDRTAQQGTRNKKQGTESREPMLA